MSYFILLDNRLEGEVNISTNCTFLRPTVRWSFLLSWWLSNRQAMAF